MKKKRDQEINSEIVVVPFHFVGSCRAKKDIYESKYDPRQRKLKGKTLLILLIGTSTFAPVQTSKYNKVKLKKKKKLIRNKKI